jgi:type I restriction enzyme S subunit
MSDFQGVDGRYFYYYFSSHFYERAMRMSAKATVDSVRLEMIADMPIALPPTFKEQKVIALCLTSLDAYIASSKAKLELLEVSEGEDGEGRHRTG